MRTGNLFIISGPSGVGKGTLVRALVSRVPDLWVSVSVTTRAPRPGEVEGQHYFFVTDEEFDRLVQTDGLLEWAHVHGNRYGTPRAAVRSMMDSGHQVVLEIDPQGAFQVRSMAEGSILVFIMPPSLEELQRRLSERGSETIEQVTSRIETARRELELVGKYDHVVQNVDVSIAVGELVGIIDTYAGQQRV